MDIHGYSAHVLVNGRKVKEYRHNGLTFIEAKNGTEFAIEVKNHKTGRVTAIVSVDGLDIIDGKPATSKSRGYVLSGLSSETLHGYRRNENEVANFKFTVSGGSYATDKGAGQNNGVIAVKLISELVEYPTMYYATPRPPLFPQGHYDSTGHWSGGGVLRSNLPCVDMPLGGTSVCAAGGTSSATYQVQRQDVNQFGKLERIERIETAPFDMGTTWGSTREERATETEFKYGAEIATLEFYYASRESLLLMGVPLISHKEISTLPSAFSDSKFAQPPKNWRA